MPATPPPFVFLQFILVAAVAVQAQTATNINICLLYRNPAGLHAGFAVDYYKPTYLSQGFNFTWEVIGQNGNGNARDLLLALGHRLRECDAFIGPGSSQYAVIVNTFITKPWLDYSATAVSLSTKSEFPYFSRVIPSDAFIGRVMARTVLAMGWKEIVTFCSGDTYGRSVIERLTVEHLAAGGHVDEAVCVPPYAPKPVLLEELQLVADTAKSRILCIGVGGHFQTIVDTTTAIYELGLHTRFVLVFSEVFCSYDGLLDRFPGAICVTFTYNQGAPVLSAYHARDPHPDRLRLAAIGSAPTTEELINTTPFGALAHDAAVHLMQSFVRAAGAESTSSSSSSIPDTQAVINRIRTVPTTENVVGGDVVLDANGDRQPNSMVSITVYPNRSFVRIGRMDNDTFTRDDSVPIFWLAQLVPSTTPPTDVDESENSSIPTALVVGIAAAVIFVLLVLFVVVRLCTSRKEELMQLRHLGAFKHLAFCFVMLLSLLLKLLAFLAAIHEDHKVPYVAAFGIIVSINAIATIADIAVRVRFIYLSFDSEDGLDFEEEESWLLRIRLSELFGAVAIDTPNVGLCFAVLVIECPVSPFVVASAMLSLLAIGAVGPSIPPLIAYALADPIAAASEDEVGIEPAVSSEGGAAILSAWTDANSGQRSPKVVSADQDSELVEEIAFSAPANMLISFDVSVNQVGADNLLTSNSTSFRPVANQGTVGSRFRRAASKVTQAAATNVATDGSSGTTLVAVPSGSTSKRSFRTVVARAQFEVEGAAGDHPQQQQQAASPRQGASSSSSPTARQRQIAATAKDIARTAFQARINRDEFTEDLLPEVLARLGISTTAVIRRLGRTLSNKSLGRVASASKRGAFAPTEKENHTDAARNDDDGDAAAAAAAAAASASSRTEDRGAPLNVLDLPQ